MIPPVSLLCWFRHTAGYTRYSYIHLLLVPPLRVRFSSYCVCAFYSVLRSPSNVHTIQHTNSTKIQFWAMWSCHECVLNIFAFFFVFFKFRFGSLANIKNSKAIFFFVRCIYIYFSSRAFKLIVLNRIEWASSSLPQKKKLCIYIIY